MQLPLQSFSLRITISLHLPPPTILDKDKNNKALTCLDYTKVN